jgi:hypothetical protein
MDITLVELILELSRLKVFVAESTLKLLYFGFSSLQLLVLFKERSALLAKIATAAEGW